MDSFGFMLKSYSDDFEKAKDLVESFEKHNIDSLPLDIVVPERDLVLFSVFESKNVTIIAEETIPAVFANQPINGIREGYINQEIVKLSYFRLNRITNYLCLDSDAYFLRDFELLDFVTHSGIPYTVLVDDKELQSNLDYRKNHWNLRQNQLVKIRKYLGISKNLKLMTCHGFQIFQSKVLSEMEKKILLPSKIDFIDLLGISPYEFTWYNYFLQTQKESIFTTEPFFRYVHSGWQFASERLLGYESSDFATGYVGLVHNSNFQHIRLNKNYDSNAALVGGIYFKTSEISRIFFTSFFALIINLVITPVVYLRRLLRK